MGMSSVESKPGVPLESWGVVSASYTWVITVRTTRQVSILLPSLKSSQNKRKTTQRTIVLDTKKICFASFSPVLIGWPNW